MVDPPATAGGTDLLQQRFLTFEASSSGEVGFSLCVAANVNPQDQPVASIKRLAPEDAKDV